MDPNEPSLPSAADVARRLLLCVADLEDCRRAVSERFMADDDFVKLAMDGHGLATFVQFHSPIVLSLRAMARALDPSVADEATDRGAAKPEPDPYDNRTRDGLAMLDAVLERAGAAVPVEVLVLWDREQVREAADWAAAGSACGRPAPAFLEPYR